MVGGAIAKKVNDKVLMQAKNAPKDKIIQESFDAGYTLPKSLYDPSFKNNLVESFGGKAATLQQASAKNQGVTNDLARKALGVGDDVPLSMSTIDSVRKDAYKPYQEIASLSKGADNALQELKQARADSNAWFNSYNRSANPEHLAKAQEFKSVADIAENVLEDYAKAADKPELITQLAKARKTIAKSYTVERAMNKSSGDIDARVLGRLYDKNKPLSDGLDTIGKFNAAFPKASQPTQMSK